MELLIEIWKLTVPLIFLIVLIFSMVSLIRFSQKKCNRILLKICTEIRKLFKYQGSFDHAVNEKDPPKILTYASFTLSTLISFFLAFSIIGSIMLYAISQTLAVFELSVLPSFFNIVFDLLIIVISAVLLIFAGIYTSKLLSYYIYKLKLPHAHLLAQIISAVILILSILLSFSSIRSATGFVKFSLLIVSFSAIIALISPMLKWNHIRSKSKSKTA